MSFTIADPAERECRRWTRENAHLYIRHDTQRFIRPDAARFMRPDAERVVGGEVSRHPDELLWNFQAAHERRGTFASALGSNRSRAAELVLLQAEHDSIRCAVLQLQQERRRKRGLEQAEAERLKRKSDAAWEKFIGAFNRHWAACRKARHPSHYNPDQPRVPAGNPDGGQWTLLASADKPKLGRGAVAAILAEAAKRAVEAYRASNRLWDLFGGKVGTVAVTTIDGEQLFGSNSTSPTYEGADRAAALELQDRLIEKYPDVMNTKDVGRRPNDALFHAETTVLTRAARANGGTLAGRTLEVHVDRKICPSCGDALPLIGLELGDPTVTFVDSMGRRRTMRQGSWLSEADQ